MTTSNLIDRSLKGARVLAVEDDWLVGKLFADLLTAFGCHVVGPAVNLTEAAAFATKDAIDIALLDLNVNGEEVYPVAEILAARNIPFVFLTGHGRVAVSKAYRAHPDLQKPVADQKLKQVLKETLAQRAS